LLFQPAIRSGRPRIHPLHRFTIVWHNTTRLPLTTPPSVLIRPRPSPPNIAPARISFVPAARKKVLSLAIAFRKKRVILKCGLALQEACIMFDNFRFAADDDLDDFGYEEEHLDVQPGVNEYGPEDEDEDELTPPHPATAEHAPPSTPTHTPAPPSEAPPKKKPVKKATVKPAPAPEAPKVVPPKPAPVKAAPAKKKAAKKPAKPAKKPVKKAAVKRAAPKKAKKAPAKKAKKAAKKAAAKKAKGGKKAAKKKK
jgi:hypothetical protein